MDQLAAKAFSAERRAHIKSLHLARLRVDLPQCAASCNLHIIERQKQPSPWTCIFAGKLCQFFRESPEAKTSSHRFGVFDKKLAYHAYGFRGFRAFDSHGNSTSLTIMLANFPHHRDRSADSAVRVKETIWPDLISRLLPRVTLGLRPPDRDTLNLKVRPKEKRPGAARAPSRPLVASCRFPSARPSNNPGTEAHAARAEDFSSIPPSPRRRPFRAARRAPVATPLDQGSPARPAARRDFPRPTSRSD